MSKKLFVYGILKRGFELDLRDYGCTFVGEAALPGAILYGLGGRYEENTNPSKYHGVGLRFSEDPERVAHGEVFDVPDFLWHWLDQIENNGFSYTRKVVQAKMEVAPEDGLHNVDVWVYEHTFPGMEYVNPIEGGVF